MNPYSEPQVNAPKTAADLLYGKLFTKKKVTERGELLQYFAMKLGRKIGYVAFRCTGLSIEDLYYLKSTCDRYSNEGKGPWAKCFYGSLKVH